MVILLCGEIAAAIYVAVEKGTVSIKGLRFSFVHYYDYKHRRRKRGGGAGGHPPNNLRGGANTPFAPPPPNNPPTFSFNFYVKQETITNVPS